MAGEPNSARGVLKRGVNSAGLGIGRVQHLSWFRRYARLEQEAVELNTYNSLVMHGLLQCESYARALFTACYPVLDPDTVEKRVKTRLSRHEVLHKWPPLIYSAILDEGALRQRFGGRDVWREQLTHLLEVGQLAIGRGVTTQP